MSQWKKVFDSNISLYARIITKYLLTNDWTPICLSDYIKTMPAFQIKDTVFSKDYKKEGLYPIVSQSKNLISGYYDDKFFLNQISKPIIIFGDHTQVVKYIDFDFILGADGTKIITISEDYNPKFFYYLIKSIDLHSNKYARHYSKLRKEIIPFRKESLDVQSNIVSFLDSLAENYISERIFFDEKTEREIITLQKRLCNISSLEIETELQKTYVKQLRQNILQDAIEGKLSADWRKSHPVIKGNPDYDAETLFEKIQIENSETNKKSVHSSNNLQDKMDDDFRIEIPDDWLFVNLSQLGSLERGRSKHRPRNDNCLFVNGTIPFVQTGDVSQSKYYGYKIQPASKFYNETGLSQSKLWKAGTLCITIAANIAETGFLTYDACFPDSVVGFTSYIAGGFSTFVRYYIDSIKQILEKYAPATAQKNINLGILETLKIPLPPLAEQTEIIRIVEEQFAKIALLELQIQERETYTKQLMQSILKDAFEEE